MTSLHHSKNRWHDQLVRRGYGTDAYGPEFDPTHLPKTERRDLALQLAAQAFDIEYLEHRYSVKLKARDIATIPMGDRLRLAARLAVQGYDLSVLENRYGVTLAPEDVDPSMFTDAERRLLCKIFWHRGHPADLLEARFGIAARRQDENG
ncbi:hypothetical protein [Leifsonia naganoensis]|uniref:Uncharacterized protein n=1 Tax=Leifsonia naganoensis TaxID=150025 RepID=A0A853DR52_9MICO|nr:hypothetical protein [Leifsonia naganoensis]NYK08580.1 hypothetical protein [Leifsonia naganoensis]